MTPFKLNNNPLPFNPLLPPNYGRVPYSLASTAPIGMLPSLSMPNELFSPEQIDKARGTRQDPAAGINDISFNIPQQKPVDGFNMGWGGAAAGIGALGSTIANTGRPSVGLGALSGAVQGAGYGAALGPMGMGLGAVIGGIAGLASSGTNRAHYDEASENSARGRIKAATTFGTDLGEFKHGGNVEGEEGELVPIQTEKGEKIVTVDGSIFNTKSTKLHKQMDSDEITDILVANSYVGSNHKSQRISKTTAEKFILGYDTITYDEEGNSSKPTERNLAEMFRKNKMTPAEVLNVIKKTFPTAEVPFDSFTKKSNRLNLKSRLPYINAVIAANLKNK